MYFMSGDTALVADLMKKLNCDGFYTVPEQLKNAIREEFWGGYCDDALTQKTIEKVFKDQGYLCDTHTAAGWAVAEMYVEATGDTAPMVVLSTASPYKFPRAVLCSLEESNEPDEFKQMERLSQLTGVPVPAGLCGLQQKKELHTSVIEKDQMIQFVANI